MGEVDTFAQSVLGQVANGLSIGREMSRFLSFPAVLYAGVVGAAALTESLSQGLTPGLAAATVNYGQPLIGSIFAGGAAGKACLVLGALPAFGTWYRGASTPSHPHARWTVRTMATVASIVPGAGAALLAHSLGMGIPVTAAMGLLGAGAGGLGALHGISQLYQFGLHMAMRLGHVPGDKKVTGAQIKQQVVALSEHLRPQTATLVEETAREVCIRGVRIKRRTSA
ncbi:MAG: hypothetical protein AMXMBFR33_67850 [Candidatus Xenobia bacterium]